MSHYWILPIEVLVRRLFLAFKLMQLFVKCADDTSLMNTNGQQRATVGSIF